MRFIWFFNFAIETLFLDEGYDATCDFCFHFCSFNYFLIIALRASPPFNQPKCSATLCIVTSYHDKGGLILRSISSASIHLHLPYVRLKKFNSFSEHHEQSWLKYQRFRAESLCICYIVVTPKLMMLTTPRRWVILGVSLNIKCDCFSHCICLYLTLDALHLRKYHSNSISFVWSIDAMTLSTSRYSSHTIYGQRRRRRCVCRLVSTQFTLRCGICTLLFINKITYRTT